MPQPATRVFITGASSGIGAALARHYAAEGATLGLFARRADALAALATQLAMARGSGLVTPVHVYAGDVRDTVALADAAAHFSAHAGTPDIVIANAGVSRGALTEFSADIDVFDAVFDTNVMGMVRTFAPFVADMRACRSGALVGIASVAGFRGLPGAGAYSASKAAAITYLESLRVECYHSGVRVVTICPGYVATPMTAHNPYRMPFLMAPDAAAHNVARAIARGKRFHVLPWQMAIVGQLLRWLPRPLYDAAFARAPRKPRAPG